MKIEQSCVLITPLLVAGPQGPQLPARGSCTTFSGSIHTSIDSTNRTIFTIDNMINSTDNDSTIAMFNSRINYNVIYRGEDNRIKVF